MLSILTELYLISHGAFSSVLNLDTYLFLYSPLLSSPVSVHTALLHLVDFTSAMHPLIPLIRWRASSHTRATLLRLLRFALLFQSIKRKLQPGLQPGRPPGGPPGAEGGAR